MQYKFFEWFDAELSLEIDKSYVPTTIINLSIKEINFTDVETDKDLGEFAPDDFQEMLEAGQLAITIKASGEFVDDTAQELTNVTYYNGAVRPYHIFIENHGFYGKFFIKKLLSKPGNAFHIELTSRKDAISYQKL